MKAAKCEDRRLRLVGKARSKALGDVGFIEETGKKAINKGRGAVEIFFLDREERRTIYYNRRVFLAQFAELVEVPLGSMASNAALPS